MATSLDRREKFGPRHGYTVCDLMVDLLDWIYRKKLLFEWDICHVSSQKTLRGQYVEAIFRQLQCFVW